MLGGGGSAASGMMERMLAPLPCVCRAVRGLSNYMFHEAQVHFYSVSPVFCSLCCADMARRVERWLCCCLQYSLRTVA